jgi:hypothetical protein
LENDRNVEGDKVPGLRTLVWYVPQLGAARVPLAVVNDIEYVEIVTDSARAGSAPSVITRATGASPIALLDCIEFRIRIGPSDNASLAGVVVPGRCVSMVSIVLESVL